MSDKTSLKELGGGATRPCSATSSNEADLPNFGSLSLTDKAPGSPIPDDVQYIRELEIWLIKKASIIKDASAYARLLFDNKGETLKKIADRVKLNRKWLETIGIDDFQANYILNALETDGLIPAVNDTGSESSFVPIAVAFPVETASPSNVTLHAIDGGAAASGSSFTFSTPSTPSNVSSSSSTTPLFTFTTQSTPPNVSSTSSTNTRPFIFTTQSTAPTVSSSSSSSSSSFSVPIFTFSTQSTPPNASSTPSSSPSSSPSTSTPSSHHGMLCMRCGRDSHMIQNCYAATHANGNRLQSPPPSSPPSSSSFSYCSGSGSGSGSISGNACFRCGRDSHWVQDCYASTHINGHRLWR